MLDSCVFSVGRMKWILVGRGPCHCGADTEREKGKQKRRGSILSCWVLAGLSTQVRSVFEGLCEETEGLKSVVLECGEPCSFHTKAMSALFLPRAMYPATDIQ